MPVRSAVLACGALLALAGVSHLEGQAAELSQGGVYRREVFRYQRAGRPDPFRPLAGTTEVAARSADLALRGVVLGANRGGAVAIILDRATNRTHRLRVGQRLGSATVVAIEPRQVQLVVQDVGTTRREVLVLPRAGERGAGS